MVRWWRQTGRGWKGSVWRSAHLWVKLVEMQLDHFGGDLLLCSLPVFGFGQLEATVCEVTGSAGRGAVLVARQLLVAIFHLADDGAVCVVEDVDDGGAGGHGLQNGEVGLAAST